MSDLNQEPPIILLKKKSLYFLDKFYLSKVFLNTNRQSLLNLTINNQAYSWKHR